MRLSINVDGRLVRMGLQNLSTALPLIGRRQIRTRMNRIVRRMQEYPSERAGQKYKRTGNFFSHWKIEEIAGATGYRIENTAQRHGRTYGQYVVGDAYGTGQAWMHEKRWKLFRDVVEQELEDLPAAVEQEITMVARRYNL